MYHQANTLERHAPNAKKKMIEPDFSNWRAAQHSTCNAGGHGSQSGALPLVGYPQTNDRHRPGTAIPTAAQDFEYRNRYT
jgi:hypothetical protein